MNCQSAIRSEEDNLGRYLKNSNENLLQGVQHVENLKHVGILKHFGILKFRDSVSKKDFKKSLNEKTVENWKEK